MGGALLGLIALCLMAGCGGRPGTKGGGKAEKGGGRGAETEAPAVEAEPVARKTMVRSLAVSGSLKARDEVNVGSEILGRVTRVTVQEGSRVAAGQVLVRLDEAQLRAQLRQAEAGVAVARARVSQAKVGKPLTTSEISAGLKQAQAALEVAKANLRQLETTAKLTDTTVESGVKQAESQLAAARESLQVIKQGARDQERAQARHAVAQAKANLNLAETSLRRIKELHANGAAPQSSVDEAVRQHELAKAQHDSAKDQESLIDEGARSEEIRVAEERVRQAETAVAQAKDNRVQKQVTQGQIDAARELVRQAEAALELAKASEVRDDLSEEDIRAAEAGVAQAEATVAVVRERLANTRIVSPLSGVVAMKEVDVGEMVSPGVPLLVLVAMNSVYFEGAVAEVSIDAVSRGQRVDVRVDSQPGHVYAGRVTEIIPVADAASRTFRVKIAVVNDDRALKPGSFARGEVQLEQRAEVLTVPRTAVVRRDSHDAVYVVSNGVVREQAIEIGLTDPDSAEVLSGLDGTEQIVVRGADTLRDGAKVRVKAPAGSVEAD